MGQDFETMRILVVEDNQEWRSNLREMYERIDGCHCETGSATTVDEAREMLRKGTWDLLSLDINLGTDEELQQAPPKELYRYCGLTLLEDAAKKNWVRGVIVISGVQFEDFRSAEDEDLAELDDTIKNLFPNAVCLTKLPKVTIERNIFNFRQRISAQRLISLASPAYVLDIRGAQHYTSDPQVVISTKTSPVTQKACDAKYSEFLYRLARQSRIGRRRLSADELIDIHPDLPNSAQRIVDDVRRYLSSNGINWRLIFAGTVRTGLYLHDSIRLVSVEHMKYTLMIEDSDNTEDVCVSIEFGRGRAKQTRPFNGPDAMLLMFLRGVHENITFVPAERVCQCYGQSIAGLSPQEIRKTARRLISEFETRLRTGDFPIDPDALLRGNDVGVGWRLAENVHIPSASVYAVPSTLMDSNACDECASGVNEKDDYKEFLHRYLAFIKKNAVQLFGDRDERECTLLLFHWWRGELDKGAQQVKLTFEDAENKIVTLRTKWKELGGPSLED